MPKLRIFNPEHDMALAFGGTNYTPTPLAQKLRRDLQMLPAWFSASNDSILSRNPELDSTWAECINKRYKTSIKAVSTQEVGAFNDIEPWGWNRYLRRRLFLDGVQECFLPSEECINDIWNLSHRRISISFHHEFMERIPELQDNIPIESSDLNEVIDFARKHPKAYVKAPWSSSGKGVYRALDINALDFTRWCSGIIKRQGSIMCEKPLCSIMDFAMEFRCDNGKTSFVGYSVFNNDTHSSFSGGLVMPTNALEDKIIAAIGNKELLLKVKECAMTILDKLIAPHYTGYAGIDMMVYRDENGYARINPCIELNLRTTMGIVTCSISNRFISPGSYGEFHIEFHKDTITKDYILDLEHKYPVQITDDNKIKSGVQMLTPLYQDSQYCAFIHIFNSSL